jgi:hypothetical protein
MAVYAGAFAWIGIFWSLVCRSGLRASLATVVSGVFLGGGYFLMFGVCCMMPLSMLANAPDPDSIIGPVHLMAGCSPAVMLTWLPFRDFGLREIEFIRRGWNFPAFAVVGLLFWFGVSAILALVSTRRFREQTNRADADIARPVFVFESAAQARGAGN